MKAGRSNRCYPKYPFSGTLATFQFNHQPFFRTQRSKPITFTFLSIISSKPSLDYLPDFRSENESSTSNRSLDALAHKPMLVVVNQCIVVCSRICNKILQFFAALAALPPCAIAVVCWIMNYLLHSNAVDDFI